MSSSSQSKKKALPPLSSFFDTGIPSPDPTSHQGRKRTVDHETGSWPTHIYADVELSTCFQLLIDKILKDSRKSLKTDLHPLIPVVTEHVHVSLSKPLMISTNTRRDLINSLRISAQDHDRFEISFDSLTVLSNEDESRYFLVIEINEGSELLRNLVSVVDRLCVSYNLPTYHDQPKFHISIAWWLPSNDLEKGWKEKLEQDLENSFGIKVRKISPCEVKAIEVKVGKDIVNIQLNDNLSNEIL